jgi:FtsH-binding integral membrane protein
MLIEVLIVLYFRSRAMSLSFSRARILFVLFSLMNGAVFSFFFLLFRELYMETTESIATTFYITAGTFSVVSLIDHFRYEALPTLGRFLIMTVVGVIIATTVNYILQSSQIMCIINYAGVLLFCSLAAYETRKIKTKFLEMGENEETLKVAFLGSLALYLGTLSILIHLIDAYGDSRK